LYTGMSSFTGWSPAGPCLRGMIKRFSGHASLAAAPNSWSCLSDVMLPMSCLCPCQGSRCRQASASTQHPLYLGALSSGQLFPSEQRHCLLYPAHLFQAKACYNASYLPLRFGHVSSPKEPDTEARLAVQRKQWPRAACLLHWLRGQLHSCTFSMGCTV
jgi:hypothetical protein